MTDILVIAAHPDDEVLGCGGTMAKLAAEGRTVIVAILGEGATSRGDGREGEVATLRDSARAAADVLGVHEVRFFGLPDNRFDTVPLLDVVKPIEALVEELRPSAVYTQHGGDLNIDHRIAFRATLTALRPMRECPVAELHAYEVPSSTEWAFKKFSPEFEPTLFEDVADTLRPKLAAMACYGGEARPFPHPRSPEALEALAKWRGAQVGLHAAEAFETIWQRR